MKKLDGHLYLKNRAYKAKSKGSAKDILDRLHQAKAASSVIANTTKQYEQLMIEKLEQMVQKKYHLKGQAGVIEFLTKLANLPKADRQTVKQLLFQDESIGSQSAENSSSASNTDNDLASSSADNEKSSSASSVSSKSTSSLSKSVTSKSAKNKSSKAKNKSSKSDDGNEINNFLHN